MNRFAVASFIMILVTQGLNEFLLPDESLAQQPADTPVLSPADLRGLESNKATQVRVMGIFKYPGLQSVPKEFPSVEGFVDTSKEEEKIYGIRLPQAQYMEGHATGWMGRLIHWIHRDPDKLDGEDGTDLNLLVHIDENVILYANTQGSAYSNYFRMGARQGSFDCQKRVLDYYKVHGIAATKEQCRKSVENLHPVSVYLRPHPELVIDLEKEYLKAIAEEDQ